ncbi:MAG TPA: histidine phosphatase family protein [Chloroflexota bacterium]
MSNRSTTIFLVRHAETEWNAARRFQGHLDSELTEVGAAQAELLAARLELEGIAAVYSSDQGRALRTADAIAGRLGLTVVPTPALREIDCGKWTGLSYDEVRSLWPADHETWTSRPDLHLMPGGESVRGVQERAMAFLAEIHRAHPGTKVCAVSHNTAVRAVACRLMGWGLERLWEGPRQPNCAINRIEITEGAIELVTVGDAGHLGGARASAVSFQPSRDGVV